MKKIKFLFPGLATGENIQRLRITPADLRRLQKNCVRCHAPFVDRVLMTTPAAEVGCTTCHRATGHAE